jgi:hypothetical protein
MRRVVSEGEAPARERHRDTGGQNPPSEDRVAAAPEPHAGIGMVQGTIKGGATVAPKGFVIGHGMLLQEFFAWRRAVAASASTTLMWSRAIRRQI